MPMVIVVTAYHRHFCPQFSTSCHSKRVAQFAICNAITSVLNSELSIVSTTLGIIYMIADQCVVSSVNYRENTSTSYDNM